MRDVDEMVEQLDKSGETWELSRAENGFWILEQGHSKAWRIVSAVSLQKVLQLALECTTQPSNTRPQELHHYVWSTQTEKEEKAMEASRDTTPTRAGMEAKGKLKGKLQATLQSLPAESRQELSYQWAVQALEIALEALKSAHTRRSQEKYRLAAESARVASDAVQWAMSSTTPGSWYGTCGGALSLADAADWQARVDVAGERDDVQIGMTAGLAALEQCLRDAELELEGGAFMTVERTVRGRNKYEGAGWLANTLRQELSPLAAAVADVLGQTFLGIYHLPASNWEPKRWSDPLFVWAVVPGGLASFDSGYLTALVVHCHDRRLRVEIHSAGPNYLGLKFHQRDRREGRMSERLPTLGDHVARIRRWTGLGELP